MRFLGSFRIGCLPRIKTRFYCAEIEMSGKEVEFVVDTGAAITFLGANDYVPKESHLHFFEGEAMMRGIGGANGYGAPLQAEVEFSNQLGEKYRSSFRGFKILKRTDVGVNTSSLGMDVLREFKISFTESQVIIERSVTPTP